MARYFPLALLLMVTAMPASACEGDGYDLLKGLVGSWEVYKNERMIGELEMQAAAGGCLLLEQWQSRDGTTAVAMHWTEKVETDSDDEPTEQHQLRQVYGDSKGWIMKADGSVENNALVYEGATTLEGEDLVLRTTLHGLGTDEVVHIGDVSRDDGATWQRMSTMKYRRAE